MADYELKPCPCDEYIDAENIRYPAETKFKSVVHGWRSLIAAECIYYNKEGE